MTEYDMYAMLAIVCFIMAIGCFAQFFFVAAAAKMGNKKGMTATRNTYSSYTNRGAHQRFVNQQMQEMNRMQNEQFMKFSLDSVTPFEHGGMNMDFGNSFNMF